MFDPEALRVLLDDQSTSFEQILAAISTVDPSSPDSAEITTNLDNFAANQTDIDSPTALLKHLHGTLRFTGDSQRYYSPDNSLIHRVIERRKGNPLSLAVIASELGRRCNVHVFPVGMPGHVLLADVEGLCFDPFRGGPALDLDDCRRLFRKFAPGQSFSTDLVVPMTVAEVATRTLANLSNAYARLGDLGQLIKIARFELAVGPNLKSYAKLIQLLELAGRFDEAVKTIERAAAFDYGTAPDHLAVEQGSKSESESESDTNNNAELAKSLQRLRAHRN